MLFCWVYQVKNEIIQGHYSTQKYAQLLDLGPVSKENSWSQSKVHVRNES